MAWQDGLPHDGWYNGNVKLQQINGTYADYRDKFVYRVENGFYGIDGYKLLEQWDKDWDAIPIEERQAARDQVIKDTTPVLVEKLTKSGVVNEEVAVPSDNGRAAVKQKPKKGKNPRTRTGSRAKGALTKKALKSPPKIDE